MKFVLCVIIRFSPFGLCCNLPSPTAQARSRFVLCCLRRAAAATWFKESGRGLCFPLAPVGSNLFRHREVMPFYSLGGDAVGFSDELFVLLQPCQIFQTSLFQWKIVMTKWLEYDADVDRILICIMFTIFFCSLT